MEMLAGREDREEAAHNVQEVAARALRAVDKHTQTYTTQWDPVFLQRLRCVALPRIVDAKNCNAELGEDEEL
jgi:hypothetical protein